MEWRDVGLLGNSPYRHVAFICFRCITYEVILYDAMKSHPWGSADFAFSRLQTCIFITGGRRFYGVFLESVIGLGVSERSGSLRSRYRLGHYASGGLFNVRMSLYVFIMPRY